MSLSATEVRAALGDTDETIRHGAIARLELSDQGAIGLLVRAMADPSWRVRREAVERSVSGALPLEPLLAALVPLLGEPEDVGLRNAGIEAIVALGAPAAPLVERELAGLPEHRKVLCDVLGRIGVPSSAPALVRCLEDADSNVQIAAAEALGRLNGAVGQEVARALLSRLDALARALGPEQPSRELLGSALLDAAARRGAAISPELLERFLRNAVMGTAALRAIGAGGAPREPSARAQVIALSPAQLESSSRPRREAALLALAAVLPMDQSVEVTLGASALAGVTEALLEATVEVQRAAALVLGASGSADAVRSLVVAGEDAALVDSVELALATLARRHFGALSAVVGSLGERARAAVYQVLAAHLDPRAVAASRGLITALGADLLAADPDLARAALGALGALGDGASAEVLASALERSFAERAELEEPWARIDAAQRALAALAARAPREVLAVVRAHAQLPPFSLLVGMVGDASDAAGLIAQLGDADPGARRRAADALAALVGRPALIVERAGLDRVADAARDALADEVADVRAAAIGVLVSADGRRQGGVTVATVDGLLRAARDSEARVRGAAARALVELARGATGQQGATLLAGLRALADAPDPLTAVPALESLLSLRDVADDGRVLDALTSSDEERKKVALHGLVGRSHLVARGELLRVVERALHDERWDLRRAAVAALVAAGELGRPSLVQRRAVETDPLVRGDLDRALGISGGALGIPGAATGGDDGRG